MVAIVGAAGVGKTTLARQLLNALVERGVLAFEHRNDFPFQSQPWIAMETAFRNGGHKGVLLLDECTRFMRQANVLIDYLSGSDDPALKVVLTANAAQWAPRNKSPEIFSKGHIIELSRLGDAEINSGQLG